jgi:hypothetical protein
MQPVVQPCPWHTNPVVYNRLHNVNKHFHGCTAGWVFG